MKILIVGGGPTGLYFGILMKRADPAHEVVVLERNRPDRDLRLWRRLQRRDHR